MQPEQAPVPVPATIPVPMYYKYPVPRCAGSIPTSVGPVKGFGGQQMGNKGPPKNMRTLAPTIHPCTHNAHPLVLHIITFQDPTDSPRDK